MNEVKRSIICGGLTSTASQENQEHTGQSHHDSFISISLYLSQLHSHEELRLEPSLSVTARRSQELVQLER